MITFDVVIGETKTVTSNFNKREVIYKTKKIYTLLTFLLITIALLIAHSTVLLPT